jgi:hypothetical protein
MTKTLKMLMAAGFGSAALALVPSAMAAPHACAIYCGVLCGMDYPWGGDELTACEGGCEFGCTY